ncbi:MULTISPECIES: TetR/AcrR family transcriptional regulator [Actinosynnema]|uniref:TetR/AcrR family transcriptional regulator n=1 Tax=Actinosynnema TaxID=40566 RepID=UPI0027E22D4C|nr:TetR/AcrR family transcriptional regulator [Actinosynnema pretiosum]
MENSSSGVSETAETQVTGVGAHDAGVSAGARDADAGAGAEAGAGAGTGPQAAGADASHAAGDSGATGEGATGDRSATGDGATGDGGATGNGGALGDGAAETPARKPARRRNRRGEGAKLREEIVDAATAILDEEGDERAVTLRSVARRIGIAAPSIYPHFPDQPSIMLAVVRREFEGLAAQLREARDLETDPRARLVAICLAYLEIARAHPGRYRTMFGGLWMPDLDTTSITAEELVALGNEPLEVLVAGLDACVAAGQATSDDLFADAVALWMGLHGLAHQRSVTRTFPWPDDIELRIIGALAHFTGAGQTAP